jgi:SAM-dependent methyltransferase
VSSWLGWASTPSSSASDPVSCPACGSTGTERFFDLDSMPVICNALFDTREQALAVSRGDLHLEHCGSCGFVYNGAFDPSRLEYGGHYENSLHFSPSFRSYAASLAARLVERYGRKGGRVLEIACGSGEFLSLLCEQGDLRGLGFDPSHVGERSQADERVELRSEWFGEAQCEIPAELIVCRHALEHIPDPLDFLRMLRRGLGDRRPALYFEVPNGAWILDEFDLWDLIYEHVGYFGADTLRGLFARAGFEILDCGEDFGRQFLWVEARPCDVVVPEAPGASAMAERVRSFATTCDRRVADWSRRLEALSAEQKRVAVWGAGSKGITFLNLFREHPALSAAVDVNPHKAGKYASGSGHPILSPESLAGAGAPELFVVMNPIYLDEIRGQLETLGLSAECLAA